jgi:hypothetical protein
MVAISLGLGVRAPTAHCISYTLSRRATKEARGDSKDEQCTRGISRPSFLAEEPRLSLPFWARRPGGRLPRLVLLFEPAVDEGPDQGTGRNTASEALAAQARMDAFFEAHRHRLSQGSHLRPQPYTSRPPSATDRSGPTRWGLLWCRRHPFRATARRKGVGGSAATPLGALTPGLRRLSTPPLGGSRS